MTAFQAPRIGLMAATPGSKGGVHNLNIIESIFAWMQCTTHEVFSLPKANEHLVEGTPSAELSERLTPWVAGFLSEV